MIIVAFFGKEILRQFFAWVEKPSVEAVEFEFFYVISGLNGYLQSLKIFLFRLYYELSKILRNAVIYAWFGESETCDQSHIFDVIHEDFMKRPKSKIFLDGYFVRAALVIISQF